MTAMPAVANCGSVTLRRATLGYRRQPVLSDVELEIHAGDFVVIGGPNGGGKSTLLKTLGGLLPLLGGTLEVRNFRFGYVPQQSAVDPPLPLTALEVVELGVAAVLPHGLGFRRRERVFHLECLRDCQALDLAGRLFGELSGGQRQRVLMARALAVRPNALLLDEPTAGVDRATQHILADLLGLFTRHKGMTVILVTHEHKPFEPYATRRLHVADGCLLQSGEGAAPCSA